IGFIHDLDNATYHDKTFNKSFPPNTTYSMKASDIPVPSDYDEKFWTTLVLVGDLDPDNPKILFVFG
ncbi:15316_t:CDS:1, partial [Gigaspora margarita]